MKKNLTIFILLFAVFFAADLLAKKKKDNFPTIKKSKKFTRSKVSKDLEAREDADDNKSVAAPLEYVKLNIDYEGIYVAGAASAAFMSDLKTDETQYKEINWMYSYGFNVDLGYRFTKHYAFLLGADMLYTKLNDSTHSNTGGGSLANVGAGFRITPFHLENIWIFENLALYSDFRYMFSIVNISLRPDSVTTDDYENTYLFGTAYALSVGGETYIRDDVFLFAQLRHTRYMFDKKSHTSKSGESQSLSSEWKQHSTKLSFGIGKVF